MRAALCLALLLFSAPAGAVETLLSARLLGGRHLAEGRQDSLSGSAAAAAAAAVPLGPRWTLFPSLSGSWSGVQSALATPGGATLFSETMEHRVAAKAAFQPARARWRLKPHAGWRGSFLRETKDEGWTDGLFDHHTFDGGLEFERDLRGGAAWALGWAYTRTIFPNYATLESAAPTDIRGRPLARELAGAKVLDSDAQVLTASLRAPLGGGLRADGRLGLQLRDYPQQRLVRSDGLLASETREDLVTTAEASLRLDREPRPDLRASGALAVSFEDVVSDQASFDPARARYEPRHYNSAAWSVGPDLAVSWGDPRAPAALSLAARYSWRRWPHRSARDAGGAYTGNGLLQQAWTLAADGRWPLRPGLALVARLERRIARANDHYQAAQRFNHDATSFLFGVALEP
ncbi:MAG: hypothetical protein HYZ75_14170 [Elusimicrobia bacterium]|nr:hypothetical protein [Elusimicrobiota bacterium]